MRLGDMTFHDTLRSRSSSKKRVNRVWDSETGRIRYPRPGNAGIQPRCCGVEPVYFEVLTGVPDTARQGSPGSTCSVPAAVTGPQSIGIPFYSQVLLKKSSKSCHSVLTWSPF